MNRLHRINNRDTLNKIVYALKELGFEKLVILSNTGSHTYYRCRIKSIGETVEIETEKGEIPIFLDKTSIRLSYRNTVCLFETSKRGGEEYRAENWFLMNADQYKNFCKRIK